jgi:hypothetical protein
MRLSNVKKKEILCLPLRSFYNSNVIQREKSEGGVLSSSTTIIFRCHARFKVPHLIEQSVAACPERSRRIAHFRVR